MKIDKDIDALIKENYTGSIVSFSEDIGRFFSVKRIFKKQLLKSSLFNNEKNVKVLANLVYILFNFFSISLTNEIFEHILEPEELELWKSVFFVLGKTKVSVNPEFEEFLRVNL